MKSLFSIVFLFLSLWIFTKANSGRVDKNLIKTEVIASEMLCGIQGLYIAMNFLKPNTQSYKQILDRFKDISPKGTSLNELKKFISEESDFF